MKKFLYLALISICCFYSCDKAEHALVAPDPGIVSNTLLANAGPDKYLIMPADETVLEGSLSADQSGRPFSFHWTFLKTATEHVLLTGQNLKQAIAIITLPAILVPAKEIQSYLRPLSLAYGIRQFNDQVWMFPNQALNKIVFRFFI